MSRGTCWAFTAVDVLEWAYRKQGVDRGWLKAGTYVRLSEQAFGIAVLNACFALPETASCAVGEVEGFRGRQLMPRDTSSGEPELLFYLKSLGTTAALPWLVCPYTADVGHDRECPGLESARASNPLLFEMKAIEWLYERHAIKRALVASRKLMAFSTVLLSIPYLLPCTPETAKALSCDPHDEDACEPCPFEPAFAKTGCCVRSERESNTMEGEFFRLPAGSHPNPEFEGGHAMGLVGYSDVFRTQHGYVGGWILKNSWFDGIPPGRQWSHARGSHSIDYFMGAVSKEDEADVCPNAHSPQNWYSCGNLRECRADLTAAWAKSSRRPLRLTCLDASPIISGLCTKGEPLFLESVRSFGSALSVACFLRDDGADEGEDDSSRNRGPVRRGRRAADRSSLICSPPVPIDDIALVVGPRAAERYPNDPDVCGHYFFPYDVAEDINAAFGGFEVSSFDVEWAPSAYAANKAAYPHLNYSLLEKSTYVQKPVHKSMWPLVST